MDYRRVTVLLRACQSTIEPLLSDLSAQNKTFVLTIVTFVLTKVQL
ncbi:MAG: hypothetical protein OFPI_41030 [Osedax symbiont Rs2]|nr:MAG: hypothetical protein OFPI_41030 [Osedax symbiont Rs2]